MIRYVSLNAFIGAWSIIMCLWGLVISLIDKNGRKVHFYCAVPWARVILRVCGITVNVAGLEHVEPNAPRIYMTNHQSFFDIFALLACLPVNFKFILKQELMKIPFLGPAMRKAGYIGIERDDPRKAVQSMKQAADRIRTGASVLIFPEGTRSSDGRLQDFKKGGFNLAVKAGCDIVPIGIRDSYRIAPKGSLKIQKGAFELRIGKPVSLSGIGKRDTPQLMEKVRSEILKLIGAGGLGTACKGRSTMKKHFMFMLLFTCLLWGMPGSSPGYVMPVDQIVERMGSRFSGFHTLIVDQAVHILDGQDRESAEVVHERIWLRSPGYCRSETIGRTEHPDASLPVAAAGQPPEQGNASRGAASGAPNRDTTFRWLLMANEGDELLAFLSRLGVNVDAVGYDRLGGNVVYCIGDKGPESPKLLIERETFLPLLFSYVPPGGSVGKRVTVRFDNFKEVDSGWYPHTIDYTAGEGQAERFIVLNVRVNPPVETSVFQTAAEGSGPTGKPGNARNGKEEDRLKEVIRLLREKYGD